MSGGDRRRRKQSPPQRRATGAVSHAAGLSRKAVDPVIQDLFGVVSTLLTVLWDGRIAATLMIEQVMALIAASSSSRGAVCMPTRDRQHNPSSPLHRSMKAPRCLQPRRSKLPTQKSARSEHSSVLWSAGSRSSCMLSNTRGKKQVLSGRPDSPHVAIRF